MSPDLKFGLAMLGLLAAGGTVAFVVSRLRARFSNQNVVEPQPSEHDVGGGPSGHP